MSLQDDAWLSRFRDARVSNGSFGVWDDRPEHEPQVAAVLESAFGRPDEASIVTGGTIALSAYTLTHG